MAINKINLNNVEFQVGNEGGGSGSGVNLPYHLVVLGDSIATTISGKWYYELLAKYPIKEAHNLANGGARWSHMAGCIASTSVPNDDPQVPNNMISNQVYRLISKFESSSSDHINEPDIVLIHCGTNDNASGLTKTSTRADIIAKYGDPEDIFYQDLSTFMAKSWDDSDLCKLVGGLRFAIELLRNKFPYVRILLSTPLYRGASVNPYVQRYLNDIIKECATYLSIPVLDLTYESGIAEGRLDDFLRTDYTHPNVRGGRLLADIIGHKLISMFGFRPLYDYHSYTISGVVKKKNGDAVTSAQTIYLNITAPKDGGGYYLKEYSNDSIVTAADGTFTKTLPAGVYAFCSPAMTALGYLNVDEDKSGIVLNLKS